MHHGSTKNDSFCKNCAEIIEGRVLLYCPAHHQDHNLKDIQLQPVNKPDVTAQRTA